MPLARPARHLRLAVPAARPRVVRGTVSSVSSSSLVLTTAKGKTVDLTVGPKTRVVPASAGGISGVHDGAHVAVHDTAGNAGVVRILGLKQVASGTPAATPAA